MSDWKLVDGVYKYKENAVEEAKEYQGGDRMSVNVGLLRMAK